MSQSLAVRKRKNLIIWSLISLLFINYIGTSLIYGVYIADKQLFIEWFCENKDHPEDHCDGSCMLHKMGHHDDEHSQEPVLGSIFQVKLNFIMTDIELKLFVVPESTEHQFEYVNTYTYLFSQPKDEPPISAFLF